MSPVGVCESDDVPEDDPLLLPGHRVPHDEDQTVGPPAGQSEWALGSRDPLSTNHSSPAQEEGEGHQQDDDGHPHLVVRGAAAASGTGGNKVKDAVENR